MDYVNRPLYTNRIEPFSYNGNVKVIVGVRRSGKSTLLKEIDNIVSKKTIRLDMDLWDNRRYRDPDEAYRFIRESIDDGSEVILIDEIQEIGLWQEVIRSLISEQNCDIYITGSNSKLLSGEFSDLLTGRCNTIDTFTLTYSECHEFADRYFESNKEDVFTRFLHLGGFPNIWKNRYSESDALSEIGDILNAIIMRDIVLRYKVRRPDLLHRIFRYICDNIGNRTSINNIHSALLNEDRKLSKELIYEYVGHLESACLIYKAETYDIKGKDILRSPYKYYVSDLGFKNVVCGFRPEDIQGYVENILYLEMRARGYTVWIGNNSGKEVDFICRKGNETLYIQATTRLSDSDVVKREFGNLKDIPDNHPKYVVVFERSPLDADLDGIRCILLEDFLEEKVLQR